MISRDCKEMDLWLERNDVGFELMISENYVSAKLKSS